MSAAGQQLVALAVEEFPDLTEAEAKLLRHAAAGTPADYRGPTDAENDPNHAETWGKPRTIRAKIIRWLWVNREAIRHIDPSGISLCGAKIDGDLDLRSLTIPCPLLFERCAICDCVSLQYAETHLLSFTGSTSGPINGDRLTVRGDLWLRDGFRAEGEVRLVGATISGDLNCISGIFLNPDGVALNAGQAKIGSGVWLRQGFRAQGAVDLIETTIGGDLSCSGGTFHNPDGAALRAGGAKINGNAWLSEGFRADGVVGLIGTTIGGDLDCDGGAFHNPDGAALRADSAQIGSNVRLRQGFRAEGVVRLVGAMIAGDLDCGAGTFHNPGKDALRADGMTVKGRARLHQGFRAEGEVSLINAKIDVGLDCTGGVFLNASGIALDTSGAHVGGRAFLRRGFRAEGEVRLDGATIAGNLDCDGGAFHNPSKVALRADGIKIDSAALLRNSTRSDKGFRAEGAVSLITATIASDLDCGGGVFLNASGIALNTNGAQVGGRAFLHRGFRAEGEVRLVGATIAGNLDCDGGTFHNPGETAIDISGGQVGGGVFLRWDFRAIGEVRLIRTTIAGHLDCGGRLTTTGDLDRRGGIFCNPIRNARPSHQDTVGVALNADSIHTGGGVFLRRGFRAEGEVRLVGATIASDLDCGGGTFHNPGEIALDLARGWVGGAAFLRREFRAEGEVRLAGATIAGDLDCGAGTFHNPGKDALRADGMTVRGQAFLRQGFQTDGAASLISATIAGNLDCDAGTFHNPHHIALNLARGQVGGAVIMQDFRAEGMLSLEDASAGQLRDEEASWPTPGNLLLHGFVYKTITGPTDVKARRAWLKRQPATSFSPQPYQQLAKVLRETGHEVAAKRILIAKEWARRKSGGLGRGARVGNWLLLLTVGYGYLPYLALGWAVLWVVLGGFLFGAGYNERIVIPTKAEAYEPDKKTWQKQVTAFYPDFNPWLYSLDTFVPIINFGQKDYWAPEVACDRSGPIRGGDVCLCVFQVRALYLYRWLHIFVGWALITLAVAGFTGLVRKE
jgi:hypothetical protein